MTPGTQIDKYQVLEELGGGGMARVYKVRHTTLGSLHALKVLNPDLVVQPEWRARFLDEGRIQAHLHHPNIAAVTDLIAVPGVAGLVVEYVEGPTLEEWRDLLGHPPTVDDALAVFVPILNALQYAHESGVVHRDIKPSNILVAKDRKGRPCPRILDFGIAKLADPALSEGSSKGKTRTGMRMGTPDYMSPEQVRGLPDLDARSDIFSVAATLHEFLAGEPPFAAESDYDVMHRVVTGNATPLRKVRPDLPEAIAECVARGLATDRGKRFQSCREFAEALQAVREAPGRRSASGRPVSPSPTPAPQARPAAPVPETGSSPVTRGSNGSPRVRLREPKAVPASPEPDRFLVGVRRLSVAVGQFGAVLIGIGGIALATAGGGLIPGIFLILIAGSMLFGDDAEKSAAQLGGWILAAAALLVLGLVALLANI